MDNWFLIAVSLVLSAFFSGMEIAFVTANKLKIEVDRSKGLLSARIIARFQQNPARFIGALLLGNNIALVIYGSAIAAILDPWLMRILPATFNGEWIVLILQTIIATSIILVSAEFLPKVFFRINPNRWLNIFGIPVWLVYYLLYPIIWIFIGISEFILRAVFKVKLETRSKSFSAVDIDHFLEEFSKGDVEENEILQEIQMFQNAIQLKSTKLRECMIPRTEIIAHEKQDEIEQLKQSFIETGLSKVLIYQDSIDNIIGYVHAYDIFRKPQSIKEVLRPVVYAPESMPANLLLKQFIDQQKGVAVIVDEFGGTSGMLTMEDVMEEIFGEIRDEFDINDLTEKQLAEDEYLFSARLEIDYLNENYRLNLPESDDYETLGGFILQKYGSIPKLGDEIDIDNYHFKILQAKNNGIDKVSVKLK
jgi:putative hemolysin